jgi:predicted amidohydrolase YtcJ
MRNPILDHVVYGARIYTPGHPAETVGAIAVRRGRIIAVGTDAEGRVWADAARVSTDMGGRTVLPGLIDAHIHLQHYALFLQQLDCETSTIEACLHKVAQQAATMPPGKWILGHGWNRSVWDRDVTSADLDRVAPHHPVFLTSKSLHAAWANTAALELTSVSSSTPDPLGGVIARDPSGRPTGILLEAAAQLVRRALPAMAPEAIAEALVETQHRLWRLGLTGVHDFDGATCFRALQILHGNGKLGLRTLKNLPFDLLAQASDLGLQSGFGDAWLKLGNLKLFADGALGPRTAAMLAPYLEEPDNRGMLLLDTDDLLEAGMQAAAAGFGMAVHAIGDRAVRTSLDAFERLRSFEAAHALPARRHRIEHLQLTDPADIARPAALHIVASMQPIHATSDMQMADRYWGNRVRLAYAWRSQLEAGAVLAFGSDAPVEDPNPFLGLAAAVTRQRTDGAPSPDGWTPSERLTLDEAIRSYTSGPAYCAYDEDQQGALAVGSFADLLVLDRDPLGAPPAELAGLRPVGTMTGGIWRYRDF